MLQFLGDSKSWGAYKSHYWFKIDGNFAELVDFADWLSFIWKGLRLQQACFFHAPNLFVCLQEATKHILFSLLTPCITCFPSFLTFNISPLTLLLSKVVRLLICVFMVKISLTFNKICFMLMDEPFLKMSAL